MKTNFRRSFDKVHGKIILLIYLKFCWNEEILLKFHPEKKDTNQPEKNTQWQKNHLRKKTNNDSIEFQVKE